MSDTADRADSPEFPPLETVCGNCEGSGRVQVERRDRMVWRECSWCEGLGATPTDFGRAVLAFVQRRLKIRAILGDGD